MTNNFRGKYKCPNPTCGCEVTWEEPYKQWLRNNPRLDSKDSCIIIGDCDLIVYRYGSRKSPERGRNPTTGDLVDRSIRWHMIVEVKTHGAYPSRSQAEALWMTGHLLQTSRGWKDDETRDDGGRFVAGHPQNLRRVELDMPVQFGGEKKVLVLSYGTHLLQLTGQSFDDSKIFWDRQPVSVDEVTELLAFERNPFSLKPMQDRMHKKERREPSLFDQ